MPDRTLFEKIWDAHVVRETPGESALLYIDLHLVHEVTSPQAFEGLRLTGRRVRRPELTIAVMDHNTPTWPLSQPVTDAIAKEQLDALERNCKEFGVRLEDRFSPLQGIVHVIGPELGLTQPGLTIVCGDSHTSTHGAFGALAWGIGTSEVEHVLATQTLPQRKPKPMEVRVEGDLPLGVTAKDIVLNIIGRIGIGGGIGHVIEYTGSAIRNLSMEGRMTVCNMSIEGGARAGMIAPDDTTFAYLEGRTHAPRGRPGSKRSTRGAICTPMRTLPTNEESMSMPRSWSRTSRGGPILAWSLLSRALFPTRRACAPKTIATRSSRPCGTWTCSR